MKLISFFPQALRESTPNNDGHKDRSVPAAYGGAKKPPMKTFKPAAGSQIFMGKEPGEQAKGTGLRISGDVDTLKALLKGVIQLEMGATGRGGMADDDLREWASDARDAIEAAVNTGDGSVTLPKFEATPDLDSFDDDTGGSDEDY